MNDLELISTKEVAKLLGVTPKTVNIWVQQGKLPVESTEKLSGARFFDPAAVAAFDPKTARSSAASPLPGERASHDTESSK